MGNDTTGRPIELQLSHKRQSPPASALRRVERSKLGASQIQHRFYTLNPSFDPPPTPIDGSRPKQRPQSMPNVDIDLGDLPYLVAVHQDENLAFEPAKIDDKGHGVLQQLKFDPPPGPTGDVTPRSGGGKTLAGLTTTTMRSATAGMREVEFAQRVPPVKHGGLVISSLRGFGFGNAAGTATLEESIIRGTDVPIKESMAFTFAWPGLPLIQAYPITTSSSLHLTRTQIASLINLLITNYFTWALSQSGQAAVPYMPWEYNMDPSAFFRRFVRVLRVVEMGDGSWTPVLGVAGLEAGPGGKWRIPVKKCEDCEKGICQAAT